MDIMIYIDKVKNVIEIILQNKKSTNTSRDERPQNEAARRLSASLRTAACADSDA